MSKKRTLEEFVETARKIHANKYDYSKVDYIANNTKVCVICPEHGEFWQRPKQHLRGEGCPKCSFRERGNKRKKSVEDFIEEFNKKYSGKLKVNKSNYAGNEKEIQVVCIKHGPFYTTPLKLKINTICCPTCLIEERKKTNTYDNEIFIKKAKEKYGDKYLYDHLNYVNSRTKVIVTCREHGDFMVNPAVFLSNVSGEKCPICRNICKEKGDKKKKENEKNKDVIKAETRALEMQEKEEKFKKKARNVHTDKYDYSKVHYINSNTKVCIICPEHGEFWQIPKNHLHGHGCPSCARENAHQRNSFTTEQFIKTASTIHEDRYDYSKVEYKNNRTKVCIICPEHGEFWQTLAMHNNERQGCPNCATLSSKPENEIVDFIKSVYPYEIIQREHKIIAPQEIDIFLPGINVGIEFNGLRWHSELFNKDKNYHIKKTDKCKKKGISLLQIFEDEWVYKKEIVKHKLIHFIKCDNTPKIYARKCKIMEIDKKEAYDFLEQYHIQGHAISTISLGAFFNNRLISVMTFLREGGKWTLNRFTTDYNYTICGIGGKLLSFFIKNYNPEYIQTYADRRWTTNEDNLYIKIGFTKHSCVVPSYYYVTNKNSYKRRYHKFNFRKSILHKKYGLPLSMTEKEMTEQLGYYRIYDCGLIKYVWKTNK